MTNFKRLIASSKKNWPKISINLNDNIMWQYKHIHNQNTVLYLYHQNLNIPIECRMKRKKRATHHTSLPTESVKAVEPWNLCSPIFLLINLYVHISNWTESSRYEFNLIITNILIEHFISHHISQDWFCFIYKETGSGFIVFIGFILQCAGMVWNGRYRQALE